MADLYKIATNGNGLNIALHTITQINEIVFAYNTFFDILKLPDLTNIYAERTRLNNSD